VSEFEKWLERRWGSRWREIHEPWEVAHLCAAWNAALDAVEELFADARGAIRALREEDPDA